MHQEARMMLVSIGFLGFRINEYFAIEYGSAVMADQSAVALTAAAVRSAVPP